MYQFIPTCGCLYPLPVHVLYSDIESLETDSLWFLHKISRNLYMPWKPAHAIRDIDVLSRLVQAALSA